MGGKTFESDGIVTPRMPTKIYHEVLKKVEGILSTLFEEVAHAIEGPEKSTHGDLDVLIVPHAKLGMSSVEEIATLLGAVRWIGWQKNGVAQFAIPWPSESEDTDPSETALQRTPNLDINDNGPVCGTGSLDVAENSQLSGSLPTTLNAQDVPIAKCIQLDLNRFSSPQDMRWQLFNTSHGDLCNILSNIVRSKGLTINTEALWVRIASAEKFNRKAGRIELSRDPEQVLQFFGLDPTRFWQPFDTLDEMMKYAATNRFFQPMRQRVDNAEASHYWTDQKYLNVRPIFTYWIETYLPTHRSAPPGKDAHLTREETLDDIFEFFGPKIKEAYETQKLKADAEIARQFLWPNVKSAVHEKQPDISDDDMSDTIKAIKRVSQYDLSHAATNTSYMTIREAYKAEDYDTVIKWAADHHSDVLAAFRAGKLENIVAVTPGSHHSSGSTRPIETYSREDDEVIKKMKGEERATWPEIMKVLGKESKSQLQAHWKMNLEGTMDA